MVYMKLKDKVDLMREARRQNISLSLLLVESAKYVKQNRIDLREETVIQNDTQ
jgi:hypothetical protein